MSVRFGGTGTDQLQYSGAIANHDPFTLTAWVYISVDRNASSTIFRSRNNSAQTGINVATGSDGQRVGLQQGVTLAGPTVLTVGTWYRIAITHTSTACAVYVAQDATGATASTTGGSVTGIANATLATIGGRDPGDTTNPFNGRIAHVRVFTAVLSQAEIEAEWLSTTPVRSSGLWASWPLTDVSTLTDQSGNGRTLTIPGGSPATEDGPPIPVTGALAGGLPVLASPGGQIVTTLGVDGSVTGALPVLAAPGAGFSGSIKATGELSGPLPVLSSLGGTVEGIVYTPPIPPLRMGVVTSTPHLRAGLATIS